MHECWLPYYFIPIPLESVHMNTEEVIYDLEETLSFPVTIKSKGGDVTKYVATELNGADGAAYKNAKLKCLRGIKGDGSFQDIIGLGSLEPLLVSLALTKIEDGSPVTLAVVNTWPSKIVKELHGRINDMCNLDETDDVDDKEKN